MTITKSHIIRAVAKGSGLTHQKSHQTVEILIEIIKNTLASHENISISNFGKFCIKQKKERKWRNPATGRTMMLPPRRSVTFAGFKKLRAKLNMMIANCDDKECSYDIVSVRTRGKELKKCLDEHRRWLLSGKKNGKRAVLAHAKLSKADLYAAYLPQVNLRYADLRDAELSEAYLSEADLQDADLLGANLTWANLDGARLQRVSLQEADLRWANLEGADLTGANLRWANLEGANLREAKLSEADLYGARLKNTDLEYANLYRTKLDSEKEFKLQGVDLY